jgi:hypothetical protein
MTEEAVEAVARAIAYAASLHSDSGVPPKWSDWRDEARAALASARPFILEEAAKVAEQWGYSQTDCGPAAPGKMFSGTITVDNRKGNETHISAAIRALK